MLCQLLPMLTSGVLLVGTWSDSRVQITLNDQQIPGEPFLRSFLTVKDHHARKQIIHLHDRGAKYAGQAEAHYGSSFFGVRPLAEKGTYLVGIEFGLNDVNEYHVVLLRPGGMTYLLRTSSRGTFRFFRRKQALYVLERRASNTYGSETEFQPMYRAKRHGEWIDQIYRYNPRRHMLE